VEECGFLRLLYPGLKPQHFSEARIEDTFDALFCASLDDIVFQQCCSVVKTWGVDVSSVNIDLTNFTVYGEYDNEGNLGAIKIEYGKPKSGQTSKKQFALEVAVCEDMVPLHFRALDGAAADVTRYTKIWKQLRETIGKTDFVTTGDAKLTSNDNLITISAGGGRYIGPEFYRTDGKLADYLKKGTLMPLYSIRNRNKMDSGKPTMTEFSGFDFRSDIEGEDGRPYYQRTVVVKSNTKEYEELQAIQRDLDRAAKHLDALKDKSQKYGKTAEKKKAFRKKDELMAIGARVKNYSNVKDLIDIQIVRQTGTIKKYDKPGKPAKESVHTENLIEWFELGGYSINQEKLQAKKDLCGYIVLVSNIPPEDSSIENLLKSYKLEYRVEHTFRRLKNSLNLKPIYLHLPDRIEVLIYLLMTIVQVMSLMDRTARLTLAEQKKHLVGLFPKRKSSRPKAEFMLDALRNIRVNYICKSGGLSAAYSKLSQLMLDIFPILHIDVDLYNSIGLGQMVENILKIDPDGFEEYLNNFVF
jgi:transposase